MRNGTENLAELAIDVGIGDDGPYPAVVTYGWCWYEWDKSEVQV